MRLITLSCNTIVAIAFTFSAFGQTGDVIYKNYCAGCHGAQLQGSVATSLIKTDWKHGGDRASIMKTIQNGIPGTEMAKWGGTLSAKEIESVTDFIIGAQKAPPKKEADKPLTLDTKLYKLKIEKVITEGLNAPWGFEFVDANRALITSKTGELYWMVNGKLDQRKITGLPKTYAYKDLWGGMMDLAIDPEYSKNGWIYIGLSATPSTLPDKEAPGMTKIVRGKLRDHQWVDEQTLFQVNDSLLLVGGTRWGCRLLIDKQGYLYFTIGDMNRGKDSQILTRPSGKTYRINRDGSIPKDNPLVNNPKFLPAIYTWGNRNVQGIAQHPVTGLIYATEHGPKGGDELNILKKGANYGWPVVTYGIDYDGSIISNETQREGMESPITYWTPSIAASAIEFLNSPKFPLWQNNLIVTALAFEEVRRLVIDGDKVLEQEILMKGYGRVRDVKIGPDGSLYVLTNTPDALLRITPQ